MQKVQKMYASVLTPVGSMSYGRSPGREPRRNGFSHGCGTALTTGRIAASLRPGVSVHQQPVSDASCSSRGKGEHE